MSEPLKRPYQRHGDKESSAFFEEYLEKIYNWRDGVGLTEMIREMHSVVIEVDEQDRHAYLEELCLMTPYHFKKSYHNEHFIYSLLEVDENSPGYIIRSRKEKDRSKVMPMNMLSPVAMKKPYTKYVGEVYRVTDFEKAVELLGQAGVEFQDEGMVKNSRLQFIRTIPSQYTWNTVGYIHYPNGARQYYVEQFADHPEAGEFLERLRAIKAKQKDLGITGRVLPIDHLATRILQQDREHAMLEYIKLTSYHYWGSYDILDQNSSTNVTRNSYGWPESKSPARVFTASNTPYFLDHLVKLPSPTESFVINYGKRMHHIAYGVADNVKGQDFDNIDFAVDRLKENGVEFLLQVIGSKDEGLKQIFSRTSQLSYLITEYIQRYNGFQGFFTKKNVAFLTQAAGEDAALKKPRMGEGNLSD
ncbi:MAG: hypothetical protein Q8P95_03685 [bacterium]|nr:hypothetical protein [bacterium]